MEHSTFDKMLFSRRFSELLLSSSETTYSLAEKLCLSAATISRYANGLMAPKMTTVRAMAAIFGVSPDWLIGKTSDKFHNIDSTSPSAAPAPDPRTAEFSALFSQLPPDKQEFVLAAMRGMIDRNN